jgi:ubiquinone/menaquinone biosynthesis C-methylase UbiE
MQKTTIFLLFFSFLTTFFACSDGNLPNSNEKQKTMDDSTFNEMVHSYEDEDRVLWQKPDLIIEKIGDISSQTVADIGAGTGYFTFRLLKTAKKVIAIDIEPKFIHFIDSIAVELPDAMSSKLETRLVNSKTGSLKDSEVNAAIMINTYIYINNRTDYLKDLYKGIASNGKVLIIDFKKKDLPTGPSLTEKLDVSTVTKELQDAGFQNISVDENSLDYQYIITGIKP